MGGHKDYRDINYVSEGNAHFKIDFIDGREKLLWKNIKELVKEYCEDEGLDYREDYSGRGMFGRSCVAITCDNPLNVLCKLFAYAVDSDEDLDGYNVQCAFGNQNKIVWG